jgi:hypothetical protein
MWHVLFWPLCCLSFFDLQPQITHLVSSNSSINVACFILAIVLSVLLWLTASDYPFGTDNTMAKIKHFTLIEEFEDTKLVIWSCKSKKDREHNGQNKTPFAIFKLFYQCVIFYFGYCVVCSSLIYSFKLPIWYLQTLLSMRHVLL